MPSLIVVTFFIAAPQAIFYSSGYTVLSISSTTISNNGTMITTYPDDDLIENKWEWTAASFYEILLFQNVLSAVLAALSYWVLQVSDM